MLKKSLIYCILFLLLAPSFTAAQSNKSSRTDVLLKEEKERFLYHLKNISSDAGILQSISRSVATEAESIRLFIMSEPFLSDSEKAKAVSSFVYLLKDLVSNISQQKFEIYDVPAALASYKDLLKAFLHHKPVFDILLPLSQRRARLMANAFWQYDESGLLRDVAVYKLMDSSPEYIFQFLKNKPGFRFADSLLVRAASYDPGKTVSFLTRYKNSSGYNTHHNIYLRQISILSENKLATELMPFVIPLAEKRIIQEEILEKRLDVTAYFQLLVNTLKNELAGHDDPTFLFHSALRSGIKQKSLSFYANTINDLHNASDNIRFASVKNLRPEDLYYIITSCEDELYTSSYLGLYHRLMDQLKDHPVDSIFQVVQYDNFRVFMRMAANYNTLADFLNKLPQAQASTLLKRFISEIESDTDTGLEKAMDVADAFTGLIDVPGLGELIRDELTSNLERCRKDQLFFGIRLYNILTQVFDLVKEKDPDSKLRKQLGNYELLEHQALQNKNGEIVELVMFYGDDDGVASFNNFLSLFTDKTVWKVTKNKFWVTIRSLSDQPLVIYANLPLDTKEELDVQAQDSLSQHLAKQSLKPVILIHRGHSYHLSKTMKRLEPSVKLALLGSCGGYNSIISVANISPDAHIIVSKKTGTKFVNDPMIEEINETLLEKKDLAWPELWSDLHKRFMKDQFKLNLFNEYLPPEKNVSLFVLKLFNSYK